MQLNIHFVVFPSKISGLVSNSFEFCDPSVARSARMERHNKNPLPLRLTPSGYSQPRRTRPGLARHQLRLRSHSIDDAIRWFACDIFVRRPPVDSFQIQSHTNMVDLSFDANGQRWWSSFSIHDASRRTLMDTDANRPWPVALRRFISLSKTHSSTWDGSFQQFRWLSLGVKVQFPWNGLRKSYNNYSEKFSYLWKMFNASGAK